MITKSSSARQEFVPGASRSNYAPASSRLRALERQMHDEVDRLADMEIERRKEVGQRLKDLRHGKRVPQRVVAEILDVSLRTVQAWEGGEFPPEYDNLEKLASYYKVSEDFILNGTAPEEGPTQLDRIERMLADLIKLAGGTVLPESARHFEELLGEPEAPGQARGDSDSESGATSAPRKARSPRTRHSA